MYKIHVACTYTKLYAEKSISEYCKSKPNLDCNYAFPIDLEPNENPFGVNSIGKV